MSGASDWGKQAVVSARTYKEPSDCLKAAAFGLLGGAIVGGSMGLVDTATKLVTAKPRPSWEQSMSAIVRFTRQKAVASAGFFCIYQVAKCGLAVTPEAPKDRWATVGIAFTVALLPFMRQMWHLPTFALMVLVDNFKVSDMVDAATGKK
jgi:hypothetical protein